MPRILLLAAWSVVLVSLAKVIPAAESDFTESIDNHDSIPVVIEASSLINTDESSITLEEEAEVEIASTEVLNLAVPTAEPEPEIEAEVVLEAEPVYVPIQSSSRARRSRAS